VTDGLDLAIQQDLQASAEQVNVVVAVGNDSDLHRICAPSGLERSIRPAGAPMQLLEWDRVFGPLPVGQFERLGLDAENLAGHRLALGAGSGATEFHDGLVGAVGVDDGLDGRAAARRSISNAIRHGSAPYY
jgi:hypothetical protein